MLQRPRFKPHYQVVVVEGEGTFVLSETHQTVLQGRLYELVAPLLDGRPLEQIRAQLGDRVRPSHLYYTLNKLQQKGYLCDGAEVEPPDGQALWTSQGLDAAAVRSRLQATAVAVSGIAIDTAPLLALLKSLQVRLGEPADLRVVVTDHYLRNELRACNDEALRTGRPWLLLKPLGRQAWLGPLLRPGTTACWECLAERICANSPVLGYLANLRDEAELPAPAHCGNPATQAVAWGLAANAIVSWIARGSEGTALEGKIQTLDLAGWQTKIHHVLRQPSCPACGAADAADVGAARPVRLESRKKTYTEDGGHRVQTPQETIDSYGHLVSPICGAVTVLDRVSPCQDGVMHVYLSGHNIARSPRSLLHLKGDLRSSSCGKGTTDAQARASALCEGLERYSGHFQGDEPRRRARFLDLGETAIHPNDCMLFSDRQLRERTQTNPRASVFHQVPVLFDPRQTIDWTPVWSLTRQTTRFLPTSFCYFDYPEEDEEYCASCSNGNAAGNTLEEAVLQGFLELVERDSVALWWYNRVRVPGVDLDSFNDPYFDRLRTCLQKHHRELWALDLTSDLAIPAFAAVSRRTDGPSEQIMFGFGAHLDARIALLRAVTELNQMLAHLLHAPADGVPDHLTEEDTRAWLQGARLADHPYLVAGPAVPRAAASYPLLCADDLKADVLLCQAQVEGLGLEMLVLEQTRREIGLPVVKVMVPGLRHFWPRFAAGRLYDVPVKLGWLPTPLAEEQLNPVGMFI